MTDYMKYTPLDLTGKPIYALKGTIQDKVMPEGFAKSECEEVPQACLVTLDDLIHANNWKPLVEDIWSLPNDAVQGQMQPTKYGQLAMFSEDAWVVIGHVMTR